MASDVKVTAKFDIIDLLDQFFDDRTVETIGNATVASAKELIGSGQSSVRGHGRFDAYKNPSKYPGKKKNARPVNLQMTGEMLADLKFRKKDVNSIDVGFMGGSSKSQEIAGYHNSGTPTMPMRAVVPKESEEWAISVMRAVREEYSRRLDVLIKKSNKK